ncbi:IS110 family RNA-guided transposase [Marinobacterium jannaschii]|uniref:IS110 family transposase n=1 Tax=Marinobacterium jannaschii TaxID=64970 RepID=UPI000684E390|nr:IS110 family transposase [Marinobacterium jannaschii]
MNNISIVGIDLTKSTFQLHGIDAQGQTRLTKKVSRAQLLKQSSKIPPCKIAMEACCGAYFSARAIQSLGHQVQLIPPQQLKPFVQRHKNDARDAQGIAEAAARPKTSSIAIKSEAQLDIQALHCIRERLIRERTAVANELRCILAERRFVMATGIKALRQEVARLIAQSEALIPIIQRLVRDLLSQWQQRDEAVQHYDEQLRLVARQDEACQQLQSIPGIGIINATLLRCHAGNGAQYKTGRQFSASLGLVPRQHSSGDTPRLMGISKRGNRTVRKQLVHGARAAYRQFMRQPPNSRLVA